MNIKLHPTFQRQPKEARIRQVVQIISGYLGQKNLNVSHLTEKIQGERNFTSKDLDSIQNSIPTNLPHLWEMWIAALTGRSVVDCSRLEACGLGASVPPGRKPPSSPMGQVIEWRRKKAA